MFQSEKSLVDSMSVEMRTVDPEMRRVMRGHHFLEHHLLDGERVEGRAGSRVVMSLAGQAVVLNRGQRLEHHRRDLGGEVVLHFPFQLHPPVLKPGPHLGEGADMKLASGAVRDQRAAQLLVL